MKKTIKLSEESMKKLASGYMTIECTKAAMAAMAAMVPECVRWFANQNPGDIKILETLKQAYKLADAGGMSSLRNGIYTATKASYGHHGADWVRGSDA